MYHIAIEPTDRTILGIRISIERNMSVAEQFIQSLIIRYGKHNISTDGGTWYPQACRFLNVEHHNHSSIEKSFIERTIQYIKDRTECFDDYFPCRKDNDCKLKGRGKSQKDGRKKWRQQVHNPPIWRRILQTIRS